MEALVANKGTESAQPKPIVQVPWFQGSNSHRNKDLSEFRVGEHTCQKTGAEYQMMYGPAYGLIRVEGIYSPTFMARKIGISKDKVAPSPHWSEVAWLTYSTLCKEQGLDSQHVRHILFTEMQDLEPRSTGALLRNPKVRSRDESWPVDFSVAAEFKPGSMVFNVVLGSSSGVDVAYFLLEHKKGLGQTRHLASIKIWQPGRTSEPCVVFTISDLPEATVH